MESGLPLAVCGVQGDCGCLAQHKFPVHSKSIAVLELLAVVSGQTQVAPGKVFGWLTAISGNAERAAIGIWTHRVATKEVKYLSLSRLLYSAIRIILDLTYAKSPVYLSDHGKLQGERKLLSSKAILSLQVMVLAVCLRSGLQFLQRQLHLSPRPKLPFFAEASWKC